MPGDSLRVLFVAPYSLDVPGGNSTAILRLVRHLGAHLRAEGADFVPLIAT